MAKIKDPILFSTYFNVPTDALTVGGLIDPFVNVDTQLFIDPVLLAKSSNEIIQTEAYQAFRDHFGRFVRLLIISKQEGDPAWRAAQRFLSLQEPPENGLGYGSSNRSGSSRPDHVRDTIVRTAKSIIDLGSEDPEMISLMGFFEENVGPDTISDFTTRVIVQQLEKITELFCIAHSIATKKSDDQEYKLPHFVDANGLEKPLVLVPCDIVRALPVANDWSDIEAASQANQRIRERVNVFLGGLAQPTVSERKAALKTAVMESAELFDLFLQSIKDFAEHYDANKDSLGYYHLKTMLKKDKNIFKVEKIYDLSTGIESIVAMVHDTIDMFKHHVEKGNLWEELWVNGIPKRERAAQLIYYAMADCFCIANNVDISPEANMGGGPVDFKFSHGYDARVLVEMKRSKGSVIHGYQKQLEHYKEASRTFHGIFVVVDFGDIGDKLIKIRAIRNERIAAGDPASDIVVIDATPKKSASKRS